MHRWPVVLIALIAAVPALARLGLGGTTGPTIPDDVTLPVSTTPVGVVSANAFPGWTNLATNVGQSSLYTSPSTTIRYIERSSTDMIIAATVGQWRDVEVTTYALNGCAVLRYANGVAVTFKHNIATHYFGINIERGITTGIHGGNECLNHAATNGYLRLYETSDPASDIPGYNTTATQNDTFTFGCVGWSCYAKFNGVEFWNSGADIRIPMEAGAVAVSGFSVRETAVDWLPLESIHSIPSASIYDMRDFGFYSVETTGSISASSTSLTVASSAGLAIGDDIIVECGAEAGACARGTLGVGGNWPAANYANDAAMDAAVPCTPGTYAYLVDSNKVRQCASNGASWYAWDEALYYTAMRVPLSLSARITNISGNTLTLDTASSATATNAKVYRDSSQYLDMFVDNVGDSVFAPFGAYRFPERIVAQGNDTLYLKNSSGGQKVTIEGSGLNKTSPVYTFYNPDGIDPFTLEIVDSDGAIITDVYVRGNGGPNGYGLNWSGANTLASIETIGIKIRSSSDVEVIDSGALNTLGSAVNTSLCTRCTMTRNYARVTYAPTRYLGSWKLMQADSTDGSIVDGEVDSDWLINGFEIFRSSGVDIIRPVGRNALMSSNSSGGDWLWDSPYLEFDANSADYPVYYGALDNFLMSVNSNIQPPNPDMQEGGEIRNPTVLMPAPLTPGGYVPIGLVINQYNPNIRVTGTYPSCSSPLGLFLYPSASSGGGLAINSTGEDTAVTGIRADGANLNASWGDVALTVNTGQSITDSVADNVTGIGTETNVITNSAYEALCP